MNPELPQLLPLPAEWLETDAAVYDTFVVPTYMRLFADLAMRAILIGEAGRLVHLCCRTGYPDMELLRRMSSTTFVGVDAQLSCLELAAQRANDARVQYLHALPEATQLPAQTFSHALLLHPLGGKLERRALFVEAARLLYGGGQFLLAQPLAGSFPELFDLLREFALKFELKELSQLLDESNLMPQVDGLTEELVAAGFVGVDYATQVEPLSWDSGRAFLDDPVTRYMLAPLFSGWLGKLPMGPAFDYLGRAIDKYFSDERFQTQVQIGVLSARR